MLDFHALAGQLGDFSAYRRTEDARQAARLARALDTLADCAACWGALRDRAEEGGRGPLRGIPQAPPNSRHGCAPAPRPLTVVATDGSQIFPDRHVEPTCYLLNVSRVAFQYGTEEPPLLAAEPSFRYRQHDLAALEADPHDGPEAARLDLTAEVVSALRDELELRWLYRTAHEERRSARKIVALADGTLIRWMLRGMKNRALEDRLVQRYIAELERFRQDGIPVASYVSRPANAEVVNLLRLHLDEADDAPEDEALRGLLDRHLFERVLGVGERSAVFASGSKILDQYGPEHHIVYVYVRLPREVGRIEMPRWVAEDPERLDLLHAVVLEEAEKGGGYPLVLAEAHERAVVRQPEKEAFYHVLERQMHASGLTAPSYSAKAASKRAPRI